MGVEFLRGSALVGASFWCGWWVLWVCDGGHGVVVCVWGWGWVLFSFVAGTWFGSGRQGFWPCLLGLGGCGGGWKLGFSGWFLVAGLMVWVCGWGFSGVGLVSAPSDD